MNAPGFLTTTSSRDYTGYTVRKLVKLYNR